MHLNEIKNPEPVHTVVLVGILNEKIVKMLLQFESRLLLHILLMFLSSLKHLKFEAGKDYWKYGTHSPYFQMLQY